MAQISIDVPDNQISRVADALAQHFGYRAEIPNSNKPGEMMPNPEPKRVFIKRQLALTIKAWVVGIEQEAAARQAREQTRQQAETELTIT